MTLRVVVADDSALLRRGLAVLLASEGLDVVGEASEAQGLLDLVATHRPDVAVVDIRMPPSYTLEGIRAAEQIRRDHPETGVLLLSQYVETDNAMALLSNGASSLGYLLKERVSDVDEFLDALQRVAAGGTALDPDVVAQLLTRRRHSPLDSLTPREREVLALMAEGRDNTTIADALVITERAVSKHIGNVFQKLGLPPSDSGHRRVLAVLAYLNNV